MYFEGFGDMASGSGQATLQAVKYTIAGREHEDRRMVKSGAGLQEAQHILAIKPGQADIEEDQVREVTLPVLQGL